MWRACPILPWKSILRRIVGRAADCCVTCASSCAINRRPSSVSCEKWPGANAIWSPSAYALAPMPAAERAAAASVCSRTWDRSAPKRGSKYCRVASGRDRPPPATAASALWAPAIDAALVPSRFSLSVSSASSAQSAQGAPPAEHAAHLRCISRGRGGALGAATEAPRITASAMRSASRSSTLSAGAMRTGGAVAVWVAGAAAISEPPAKADADVDPISSTGVVTQFTAAPQPQIQGQRGRCIQ